MLFDKFEAGTLLKLKFLIPGDEDFIAKSTKFSSLSTKIMCFVKVCQRMLIFSLTNKVFFI